MKKGIPFGKPLIGEEERAAVMKVLEGPILVHGPVARELEESFANYTGASEAITTSSCTAGMHLVYFALGFGAGDEVIVPAQTHVATAHAVELTGAKPVFVDSEQETGNIDISEIEKAITPKTKAIAVVHYLGLPVDMPKVCSVAKRYGLFVLEDCALAPGAAIDGTHVGLHGDVGVFSFYPIKHITTAEGGMIILRNKELAKRLRLLKAFGVDRTHSDRKVSGLYDAVALGFNYRMSEIHAAIGIEQLKKLPNFLNRRYENYLVLQTLLEDQPGIRILPESSNKTLKSSNYCMGVLVEGSLETKRDDIKLALEEKGIGTSIYYPQPVPKMSYYRNKYRTNETDYPNATKISRTMISLPVGPHLEPNDMHLIAQELGNILKEL